MANEVWYDYFLKALLVRYPKRGQLVEELMNLLCIERESVYRRLRKEVIFPASEIVKIASAWNISLDGLIGIDSGKISFQMQLMDYLDPDDQEARLLQAVVDGLLRTKNFPDSEYMEVCNRLPRLLLAGYSNLNQFYLFKWIYQYSNRETVVPFSQVIISEEKRRITSAYYKAVKQIPNTSFIFSHKLFNNILIDIQYFHSIQLVTDEEKESIRNELYDLLDYLLKVANKGCYPETNNKVNLYISQLIVDTNYSYIQTDEVNICFVHAFDKYEIYTLDPKMFKNFKEWMKLKLRTSIQISKVDEKSRIDFFAKARQVVESI